MISVQYIKKMSKPTTVRYFEDNYHHIKIITTRINNRLEVNLKTQKIRFVMFVIQDSIKIYENNNRML